MMKYMQSWIPIYALASWGLSAFVLTSAYAQVSHLDLMEARSIKGPPPVVVTRDRISGYILGTQQDPAGLDVNEDGKIDVSDILCFAATENAARGPEIGIHDVYVAYPGFSIALPIDATGEPGTTLSFTSDTLPPGASLGSANGILTWTPALEQVGPWYVHFTVTDDAKLQRSSDGILIFQIRSLTDCDDPVCDPATGCDFLATPIDTPCVGDISDIRLAEPDAPCPEGRVLHVGRNRRGFGRLQHSDILQVAPFGQGGSNVNLNFEVRCINASEPVRIFTRLETVDEVLFATLQTADLQIRPDGFAHVLGLTFFVDFVIDFFALEGKEALLTTTLTDADGVTVSRNLRLRLTLGEPSDFPNPNRIVAPGAGVGCVACHRPVDPITLTREGIEDPHPGFALSCTDCHGGNNDTNVFEVAHVFPETGPEYIRDLAYDKLNEVPLDYVRFINPGDYRIAQMSCGIDSPANSASATGCHQSLVESAPTSVMSTYAGHYKLPRFMSGGQGRDPIVAAVDIVDPHYDPDTAPEGTVPELTALREPAGDDMNDLTNVLDVYLPKNCATCHAADFGRNDGPGKYRSSGCSTCHMLYDDNGLSSSNDPAIIGYFPPHSIKHELTTAIPTEQCTHCHFQGGRIGLSFRGIREGGFPPAMTPPNAEPWDVSIYGHSPGYYLLDEDNTNSIDETPPDLHFVSGMDCADCHVGRDVHGDGYIYASERDQVGIRCEDCHGTVRETIVEDPFDGLFKNSVGAPFKRIRREGDQIILKLIAKEGELVIPQIHELLESGINPRMNRAMGVRQDGTAHPDTMECYSCHNAWRQTCYGCHVTVNDDASQLNLTTGEVTQGGILVSRDIYSIDILTLGMNSRGKVAPLCSSMSVFMSYINEGKVQYRDRVRETTEGTKGFGWNPFHHHTTTRSPMSCDRCHPVGDINAPDNAKRLNEAYGFGGGEILITDGDGTVHDVTAFLSPTGELISTFPHPNTGPVTEEIRNRALSVLVEKLVSGAN